MQRCIFLIPGDSRRAAQECFIAFTSSARSAWPWEYSQRGDSGRVLQPQRTRGRRHWVCLVRLQTQRVQKHLNVTIRSSQSIYFTQIHSCKHISMVMRKNWNIITQDLHFVHDSQCIYNTEPPIHIPYIHPKSHFQLLQEGPELISGQARCM